MPDIPSYLAEYADTYKTDPHAAALQWFAEARFGLFIHYGVYSLLGRGEWVQLREKIPVAEYEKLKDGFSADLFDADAIVRLAKAAGMRYVNVTTRHHDSFCLFETAATEFNSLTAPAGRDLVAELAEACRAHGLGLFLYYSLGADWHHPYFYAREHPWDLGRPDYPEPQPEYLYKTEADFEKYIDFVRTQLRELLTQYGPVAGIWFDPIMGYYARPHLFPMEEIYGLIRELQPQTLVSFKQGATGAEDFASPEHKVGGQQEKMRERGMPESSIALYTKAWDINKKKHNEVCGTMHPWWGYTKCDDSEHKTPEEVWRQLGYAASLNCNLCLNTGPLPKGTIHPVDAATLRAVGDRIEEEGYPDAPPAEQGDVPSEAPGEKKHGGPEIA